MELNESIRFKKLHPDAKLPIRGTENSAGFDLYALEDTLIVGGAGNVLVRTGIAVQLPEGTYGRIAIRSGLAVNQHLNVSAGVIDKDYDKEIGVVVFSNKLFDLKEVHEMNIYFDKQGLFNLPDPSKPLVQPYPIKVTETLGVHLDTLKKHSLNKSNPRETLCTSVYPMMNPHAYVIKKGERFAQLIPEKISYAQAVEVKDEFARKYNSHAGYGSTGSK